MLRVSALLSIVLCSSLAQDSSILARLNSFSLLNPSPLYELYWNVTGNMITFAVRVQTNGWVGFGISPDGLMPDSDVVMGFVDDTTGAVTFTVSIMVKPQLLTLSEWFLAMKIPSPLCIKSLGLHVQLIYFSTSHTD